MNGGATLSPGDTWRPTAAWVNAVNRMLVLFGGRVGEGPAAAPDGVVQKVQVYNAGSSALAAGQAVEFVTSGAAMVGDMIPCSALTASGKRWGVLTSYLEPAQGGGCVIAGPVTVERIVGSGGMCAAPVTGSSAIVSGAQVWSRGGNGVPLLGGTASGGVVVLGMTEYPYLAKVQTFPVGGVGMGTVKAATAVVSGAIVVDSGAAAVPVVMPYLDGDN